MELSDTPRTGERPFNLRHQGIYLILSEGEMQASDLLGTASLPRAIAVKMLDPASEIPADLAQAALAMVLEVQPRNPASMARLDALRAARPDLHIVAAVRDADLPTVRALIKRGVADVIGLPLQASDLAGVLKDLSDEIARLEGRGGRGRLISVIKSVGGVGATTIATQAASLHARRLPAGSKGICLFDLDLQFGNAATYLGISTALTLNDLLLAGSRIDDELMKTVAAATPSGLNVIAAPSDISPIESVNADQIFRAVDLAQRAYDAVYLDLPGNWTNWSLSLAARSDIVLLVVEVTVASLKQARRQLDLLKSQDIDPAKIVVVANRVEKSFFRTISLEDAETALHHPISLSLANDFPLVNASLNEGILISDVKAKSRLCKDLQALVDAVGFVEKGTG